MSKESRWRVIAVVAAAVVIVLFARNSMRIRDLEDRLDAAIDTIHVMNFSAREHDFVVCDEEPILLGDTFYDHPCRPILTFEQSERLKAWLAEVGFA